MSHAFAGVLTCGNILSIELDRMFLSSSIIQAIYLELQPTKEEQRACPEEYLG
jgi:hypothetical protein